MSADTSNGYDAIADAFIAARSDVGLDLVTRWAASLPKGASIVDVGAGHGLPLTRALVEAGLDVFAIEASQTLAAALRHNLPGIKIGCEPAETSTFFHRTFDAAIAVGLIFLMEEDTQAELLRRMAGALTSGGRLLFSAPHQACAWTDLLTGRSSRSLGRAAYARLLSESALTLITEHTDEGGSHYFEARKSG